MRKKTKLIIIIALGVLMFGALCVMIGFYLGVATTINREVAVAAPFIDIDGATVERAMFMYHNNIDSCFNEQTLIIRNESCPSCHTCLGTY